MVLVDAGPLAGCALFDLAEPLHTRCNDILAKFHQPLAMKKYSDNPMDLAEASLVAVAEHHSIKKVFTLDRRDFSRYRPQHCARFEIIS